MSTILLMFLLFICCIVFCISISKEAGLSDIAKEYISITAVTVCAFLIVSLVLPLFAIILLLPIFGIIFKEIREAYNEATEYHRLSNLRDN